MKIRVILIVFAVLFCSTSLFAQYSYNSVEPTESLTKGNTKYYVVKKDTLEVKYLNDSELEVYGKKYRASEQDVVLSTRVFYNFKLKTFILLVNKTVDYSLGCDVFSIEAKKIQYLGPMTIAAYTSDKDGRMNYNSILPYVSIVKVSNRTIFSFETPLVVVNPGMTDEETLKGNEVYFTLTNSKLEISK